MFQPYCSFLWSFVISAKLKSWEKEQILYFFLAENKLTSCIGPQLKINCEKLRSSGFDDSFAVDISESFFPNMLHETQKMRWEIAECFCHRIFQMLFRWCKIVSNSRFHTGVFGSNKKLVRSFSASTQVFYKKRELNGVRYLMYQTVEKELELCIYDAFLSLEELSFYQWEVIQKSRISIFSPDVSLISPCLKGKSSAIKLKSNLVFRLCQ